MRRLRELPTTEEIAFHSPQSIADKCGIPIVWTDHQVTRRQRLHGANLPNRTEGYTSTHFNEILEHVAQQGFDQAIFICETPRLKHLACYIEFQPLEG